MAELAIAAVGSAIGGATLGAGVFGVSGAAIGWFAGSMIANALLAPTVEGPKLSDKKVQISSYGAPVSLLYGGVRVAGNLLWTTDLIEHKRKEGGKGGAKSTRYSYTVSCATIIGEGPITSIRRIWADAKCVYDARADAPAASLAATAKFAKYITFYNGSEAQLPDPTMESKDGAGNVPAYRGTAYMVFTDLPLEDYGNRIPSFSFEVSTAPAIPATGLARTALVINPWVGDLANNGRPIHAYDGRMSYLDLFGNTNTNYAAAVAANCASSPAAGATAGRYSSTYVSFDNVFNSVSDRFPGGAKYSDNTRRMQIYHAYEFPDVFDPRHLGYYPENAKYCGPMKINGATVNDGKRYYTWESNHQDNSYPYVVKLVPYGATTAQYVGVNNCVNYPSGLGGYFPIAVGSFLSPIYSERVPSLPGATCGPGDPCGKAGIAEMPDDPHFCISCNGTISFNNTWHYVTGTAKQLCSFYYTGSDVLYQQALGPVVLPDDPNYSNAAFWEAEYDAAIANGTLLAGLITRGSNVTVTEWAEADVLPVNVVPPGSVRLSEIVSKLSLKSGLTAGQIDVTPLTDYVQGYTVGRQSSARQAIEQLRSAYFFDAVESNNIIKYVKRGQVSSTTILADALGASEDGNAPVIEIVRKQETELPATVNVVYSARSADYQTGTQVSKRQTTKSVQEATVELSIVMSDTKALQVGDSLLYDAFASRTTRTVQTSRQYAHVEPTDVITVIDNEGFTYTLFVSNRTEDGGKIRFECQDQDKSAYKPPDNLDPDDPTNTVVASNPGPTTGPGSGIITPPITLPGPTKLILLDIPLLRQADLAFGYYAAVTGYRDAWRGGYVYRSDDAGTTYVEKLNASNAATLGYCLSALAPFTGGNVVDELSSIDVRMHTGAVSSITRDQLLGGANPVLIGSEVLQFQRATLVSVGVYRLTGLLRGRLGTERFIATHAADEQLISLDPAKLYRVEDDLTYLNAVSTYRGITYGDAVNSATPQTFTNTGASMRALAPVELAAGSLGGGIYRVNWTRRTRYGGEWLPFVDVPLDMTIERYRVKVLRANVQVDGATVTGVTQTEVLAMTGDTIEVSQISDRVGLGFTATTTVP